MSDVTVLPPATPAGSNSPDTKRGARDLLYLLIVALVSALMFLLYFGPLTLHDSTHYVISGTTMVRDRMDLLYPYFPHRPLGYGNAYEYLQDGTINFDSRTNYPAKLYSYIFGLIYLFTGSFMLPAAHWVALATCILGNVFLFLIGRRFFGNARSCLLVVSVAFLPLMVSAYSAGTDGIGYTASVGLLWLCLVARVGPLALGAALGASSHLRGQMVSLLAVLPLINQRITCRSLFLGSYVPMAIGFVVLFIGLNILFDLHVAAPPNATTVDFYLKHFQSVYGLGEIQTVLNKALTSFVALLQPAQLFAFAVIMAVLAMLRERSFARALGIAATIYVALPLVLYSFDRFAPPQARYYMFAVPTIALGAFFVLFPQRSGAVAAAPVRALPASMLLAFASVAAWSVILGLPWGNLAPEVISSRYHFLQFEGAEAAMQSAFRDDDIIIANHSLPSALSHLKKFVYVPPLELFMKGDNRKLAGLVFVYGDQAPNDFFKPKDWFPGPTVPDRFTDEHNIRFDRVYAGLSELKLEDGAVAAAAHYLIYKRQEVALGPDQ